MVDEKGRVSFSQLADSRLVYRAILQSPRDVLTQKDLQEMLAPPAASTAAVPATATSTTTAPATTAPAATPTGAAASTTSPSAQKTLAIPDARKKELLLLYLNRLLDIVFSQ
jgi:hypothetical protein